MLTGACRFANWNGCASWKRRICDRWLTHCRMRWIQVRMRLLRLAATLWLSCLAYVMPVLGFTAHAQSAQALFAPQYIELGNGLRVLAGQPKPTALFTEALLVVRAGT